MVTAVLRRGSRESVTLNVSGVEAIGVVGVPLIKPVDALRVNPAGNVPEVNCQVKGTRAAGGGEHLRIRYACLSVGQGCGGDGEYGGRDGYGEVRGHGFDPMNASHPVGKRRRLCDVGIQRKYISYGVTPGGNRDLSSVKVTTMCQVHRRGRSPEDERSVSMVSNLWTHSAKAAGNVPSTTAAPVANCPW